MSDAKPSRRQARIARFYQRGPIEPDTELFLDKQATHHLINVLRTRVNDQVTLFNGDGFDYQATVVETGQRTARKAALLRINERVQGVPDSPLHITLVQCVSRPERMDISLRQSVELGVNSIQPVYSRHSVKAGDDNRVHKKQLHWQSVVTSACEQSGRSTLPELKPAMSFTQWLQCETSSGASYVLSPSAELSLAEHAMRSLRHADSQSATIIVGPESGLDQDEIDSAVQIGAIPAHLGQRILRTETAGPACIVILQSSLGDMQPC